MLYPAGAAHAEPPGDDDRPVSLPPGITVDQVRTQQVLDDFVSDVWKLVPNDGADSPGYASVTIDRESGRVVIYWRGAVPEAIRALQESRMATVLVVQARYSQRQAERAAQYIFGRARLGAIPQPTRVGLNETGDQLRVGFTARDLATVSVAELSAATEAATGVRPTVVADEQRFVGA